MLTAILSGLHVPLAFWGGPDGQKGTTSTIISVVDVLIIVLLVYTAIRLSIEKRSNKLKPRDVIFGVSASKVIGTL